VTVSDLVVVELHGVSVQHHRAAANGIPALHELNFSIAAGEQVAVIGSSGAGKTTLLHLLAAALRPDVGEFKLFGNDPWLLSNARRHALRARLFLAPQTPPLPPRQRVITTVLAGRLPQWSLWQAIVSLIKPSDSEAAYQALARFDLQDKLYARVDRLSGGERQRCGMARLLLSNAEILLIDEPLSALDPTLSRQTLTTLLQEAATRHATLICSLHHVEFARAYFPRIIGLRQGRIVFDARSVNVTDVMVNELYQNEHEGDSTPEFQSRLNINAPGS
jgi:phosphonate transport system ATP-binding protein